MRERLGAEIALVRRNYPDVEVDPAGAWVMLPVWELPGGWSLVETMLLIVVPPGYPATAPDNFYTNDDLRLAAGGEPGNSGRSQTIAGRVWRVFSWHVDGQWRPRPDVVTGDNLLTYLEACRVRLSDPS